MGALEFENHEEKVENPFQRLAALNIVWRCNVLRFNGLSQASLSAPITRRSQVRILPPRNKMIDDEPVMIPDSGIWRMLDEME